MHRYLSMREKGVEEENRGERRGRWGVDGMRGRQEGERRRRGWNREENVTFTVHIFPLRSCRNTTIPGAKRNQNEKKFVNTNCNTNTKCAGVISSGKAKPIYLKIWTDGQCSEMSDSARRCANMLQNIQKQSLTWGITLTRSAWNGTNSSMTLSKLILKMW